MKQPVNVGVDVLIGKDVRIKGKVVEVITKVDGTFLKIDTDGITFFKTVLININDVEEIVR